MKPIELKLLRDQITLGRRQLFQRVGMGLGSLALGSLLNNDTQADAAVGDNPASDDAIGTSTHRKQVRRHVMPRAKSVIYLHMVGAPSQLDLFDYKPVLQKHDGQLLPDDLWEGLKLAFIRKQPKLLGTRFKFACHGDTELQLSELLPNLATVADDITMVKSLFTEQFNHAPAQLFMQTGFGRFGRPCLGSWTSYGLGTENQDLPSFVVMNTGLIAGAGNSLWGSGFLPTVHQGVEFRSKGDPVLFLSNPPGVDRQRRRRIVQSVNRLNEIQLADVGSPEIATRINQYEMAFRMQASVPELMDITQETAATHAMYGTIPGKESFANSCLLARRLVERGVRFVQLYDQGWDHHASLSSALPRKCRQIDRPIAALLKDLKQRGLLDETLVIFGAEFGRTPMLQNRANQTAGRDHHKEAFCMWMAGGGTKPGTFGASDDIGFNVVENPVHVNDIHATILHLLGIDHKQLTYRYQGRDFRLTDVGGRVIDQIVV